ALTAVSDTGRGFLAEESLLVRWTAKQACGQFVTFLFPCLTPDLAPWTGASEQTTRGEARPSALRFGPVVARADVDRQRRVEVVRAAHLGAYEIAHLRELGVGHLEQQLVVHLEDES